MMANQLLDVRRISKCYFNDTLVLSVISLVSQDDNLQKKLLIFKTKKSA
ncbi:hypothetical protein THERMOT_2051 [Bathymodiolus thermophilus thioautotrophic gill symbiont]|nr:hypothetical protein THERMOT_2051 [Bathymodiolus thermophilus thioautotrophic gill symbiont]